MSACVAGVGLFVTLVYQAQTRKPDEDGLWDKTWFIALLALSGALCVPFLIQVGEFAAASWDRRMKEREARRIGVVRSLQKLDLMLAGYQSSASYEFNYGIFSGRFNQFDRWARNVESSLTHPGTRGHAKRLREPLARLREVGEAHGRRSQNCLDEAYREGGPNAVPRLRDDDRERLWQLAGVLSDARDAVKRELAAAKRAA